MSVDAVLTRRQGKLLHVTLDRPPANAIDAGTSRRLGEIFAGFRDDEELLTAILWGGEGRIFSAGWDLKAAAAGEAADADMGEGGFAGLTEMFDLRKPVIAAVNGAAVGGGAELALACDLIVMAEDATFSLPETRVGAVADSGGLQRLPQQLPYRIALEMLLTGRRLTASEALHFGLVNAVVPKSEVPGKAEEMAAAILEGAPLSVQAVKEALREFDGRSVRESFAITKARSLATHRRMYESEDHLEGPRAFAEKRPPQWKGR